MALPFVGLLAAGLSSAPRVLALSLLEDPERTSPLPTDLCWLEEMKGGVVPKGMGNRAVVPRKIALAFHGEYYRGGEKATSFFESQDNITKSIIEPLQERGSTIYTYFHSFKDSPCRDQKLLQALRPVKHNFSEKLTRRDEIRMVRTYMSALQLVLEDAEELGIETVLLLRFDVAYRAKITDLNIQWAKFNMAHHEGFGPWPYRVSDLFFVIPIKQVRDIIKSFDMCGFVGHDVYKHYITFKSKKEAHFIDENCYRGSAPVENSVTFLGIDRRPSTTALSEC